MFPGDDYLNFIQTEANNLVDSILDESVTILNNNSSSYCPSPLMQANNQQSEDKNLNLIDINDTKQPSELPLININNYSINPSDMAQSDDMSESYAIKSDCDIIVKSPTIESMSGKSFDDDFNAINDSINNNSNDNVNYDIPMNNTATNIPSTSNIAVTEHSIPSANPGESTIVSSTTTTVLDDPNLTFLSKERDDSNEAIVRNLSESKLRRIERKFEHLSSQVDDEEKERDKFRETSDSDNENDLDIDPIDSLVNKEDISVLQNEFSKISWDESLSATTGDFGSSTPDNDLHDVLTTPGDTK